MARPVDFSADLILVCNSLDAGGIERVVSTLANEWSRQGRRVSVVTFHDRKRFYALDPAVHHVVLEQKGLRSAPELVRTARTRFTELRRVKGWLTALLGTNVYNFLSERIYRVHYRVYLALETRALRAALKRIESPVVIAFGTSINVITLKACRTLGRRVIISERNDPAQLKTLWGKLWLKHYRQAHRVTANTRSALTAMRGFVDQEKLAFVPNPIELRNGKGNGHGNGYGDRSLAASSPLVILNVGRLVDDKAHDILLDAFAQTGEELKNWRLGIVGEGVLGDNLRAQAKSLGIDERVDWHGVVRDPYPFYHASHVFALPSRVEGTPNALLEAMSCGMPVIVSDGAPGPLELVEDDVTGLVVRVNDPVSLAAALRRLGNDGALRQRLGAAARQRVTAYELPRALADWESVVGLR